MGVETGRGQLATNIIVRKILYSSTVLRWQLHHLALQPPLGGISGDRLAPGARRRLVLGADPRSQPLVGNLSREVAIYGGYQLIVEMLALAIVRVEDGVYSLRVLGLVQAPCDGSSPPVSARHGDDGKKECDGTGDSPYR